MLSLPLQDTFPVRDELLSDLTDDDLQPATAVTEPLKPMGISFKHKNETDLFGLGIHEEPLAAIKDSSEEQEGKKCTYNYLSLHMYGFLLLCPSFSVLWVTVTNFRLSLCDLIFLFSFRERKQTLLKREEEKEEEDD